MNLDWIVPHAATVLLLLSQKRSSTCRVRNFHCPEFFYLGYIIPCAQRCGGSGIETNGPFFFFFFDAKRLT